VVAAQNGNSASESALESEQQGETLDRVLATVHLVAHEEVVGLGNLPADLEQFDQVVELAVHVATHHHRCVHGLHVAFLVKDFLAFVTQSLHILFF